MTGVSDGLRADPPNEPCPTCGEPNDLLGRLKCSFTHPPLRADPQEGHRIELVSEFLRGGWSAACSCGWTGPNRHSAAMAEEDARSHPSPGAVLVGDRQGQAGSGDDEAALEAAVDAFEAGYAEGSDYTVEQLHSHGRWGAPCHCGEEGCEGFQMLHCHDELDRRDLQRKGLLRWVNRASSPVPGSGVSRG